MTMTAYEEKVLTRYISGPHASGTIHEIIGVLASVALKQESIRRATAPADTRPDQSSPSMEKNDGV